MPSSLACRCQRSRSCGDTRKLNCVDLVILFPQKSDIKIFWQDSVKLSDGNFSIILIPALATVPSHMTVGFIVRCSHRNSVIFLACFQSHDFTSTLSATVRAIAMQRASNSACFVCGPSFIPAIASQAASSSGAVDIRRASDTASPSVFLGITIDTILRILSGSPKLSTPRQFTSQGPGVCISSSNVV